MRKLLSNYIGAGTVVTDGVDPYAVVAGNPGECKRFRFSKAVRDFLLELEWWEWSKERLRRNEEFLTADLTAVEEPTNLDIK